MKTQNRNKNIIFGTGPLGLSVMDELVKQGKSVTLVNRVSNVKETLPDGVTLLKGDATRWQVVAEICTEADAVFHCAQPAYNEWPEKFPAITQGIMDGVSLTNSKLIFGDNLYMYGPTKGLPLHEDLPYSGKGPKGQTRASMATRLLGAHHSGKVKVAIGRASDFYGPRVAHSVLGQHFFASILSKKTAPLLGNVDQPHTYTYVKDFAKALVTLSEHDEALGKVWHVPNATTLTTRQLVTLVSQHLGSEIKIRSVNRFILSILGLFNPMMREMKEMLYEFEEPFIVDHSLFSNSFETMVTPINKAIQETLGWYQSQTQQAILTH